MILVPKKKASSIHTQENFVSSQESRAQLATRKEITMADSDRVHVKWLRRPWDVVVKVAIRQKPQWVVEMHMKTSLH